MGPIETLIEEHVLISRFIDLISAAADEIDEGRLPPREFFEMGVEFASRFADVFHHRKEEHLMFVRLAQIENGSIDGQIEALKYQHVQGRAYVASIADSLDGYADADPEKIHTVHESAAAYASLLRHHIHTEDHVFFPMARTALTDRDLSTLQRQFDQVRDRQGEDVLARYHEVVADMSRMLEGDINLGDAHREGDGRA